MEGHLNLFNEAEQEQDVSLLEEEQKETKTVTFMVRKGRYADKDRYAGLPVEKSIWMFLKKNASVRTAGHRF